MAAHPGMPRNVMPPGFEEELNSDSEHLMPLARRWGGFNLDYVTKISSTEKVVAVHGL